MAQMWNISLKLKSKNPDGMHKIAASEGSGVSRGILNTII